MRRNGENDDHWRLPPKIKRNDEYMHPTMSEINNMSLASIRESHRPLNYDNKPSNSFLYLPGKYFLILNKIYIKLNYLYI